MQAEYLLLNILLYKSCFNAYKDDVNLRELKETYRELGYVFDTVYDMHGKVEGDLSVDDVAAFFWAKFPTSDKDIYGKIFEQLKTTIISPESASAVIAEYKNRQLALQISNAAMMVATTGGDLTKVKDLIASFNDNKDADLGVTLVTDDIVSLIGERYETPGYRWRLDCLNKALGSLRDGDFGFIFARPETGKTTFLASEISNMLAQDTERPIVWFNNEEQDYKVKLRVIQAWFGIQTAVLLSNLKKYQDEFIKQTAGRFLLFDGAPIHRRSVERVVAKYRPGLVVYDQLTKISGFSADRQDLELGAKFQWARELAKNSHAAIGVSQADGTAEGVRYLTMEHVANAKTAVQAEADFILGIGDTRSGEDVRYLSISKNKLLGDKDSKEELRHGKIEVLIEPTIARYKDIIRFD